MISAIDECFGVSLECYDSPKLKLKIIEFSISNFANTCFDLSKDVASINMITLNQGKYLMTGVNVKIAIDCAKPFSIFSKY